MPDYSSRVSLSISFFLLFLIVPLDKVRDYTFIEVDFLLADVEKL